MARQHLDYWQFDEWGKLVVSSKTGHNKNVAPRSNVQETNTGVLDEITKERPFTCELCGKDFVNKVGFQIISKFFKPKKYSLKILMKSIEFTKEHQSENLSKNRLTNHKEHVHGFYERPNTSRRRMSARQLLDEISDDQSGVSTNQEPAADENKENSEENHKDNYCYVCNRQFENKTGFTVHMTKQHNRNSNNSNNSNNAEPSSKRFKSDCKYTLW